MINEILDLFYNRKQESKFFNSRATKLDEHFKNTTYPVIINAWGLTPSDKELLVDYLTNVTLNNGMCIKMEAIGFGFYRVSIW